MYKGAGAADDLQPMPMHVPARWDEGGKGSPAVQMARGGVENCIDSLAAANTFVRVANEFRVSQPAKLMTFEHFERKYVLFISVSAHIDQGEWDLVILIEF